MIALTYLTASLTSNMTQLSSVNPGPVGYGVSEAIDLSAGYRYLAFQNGGSSGVRKLLLCGAILVANFGF